MLAHRRAFLLSFGTMFYTDKNSIKSWAEDDRPREKLLLKGIHSLSDAELIAILIGSGSRNETAVDLARRILSENKNSIIQLSSLSVKELSKYKGIGTAKAVSIVAALELGRRQRAETTTDKKKITSSKDVYDIMSPLVQNLKTEEFWVLHLSRSNAVIEKVQLSKGGIAGTVVDTRIIFKQAIENLACSIILCHNHPSGNKQPSNQDISITKNISKAGSFLDIKVLDHIIIGGENYYSFADEGIM